MGITEYLHIVYEEHTLVINILCVILLGFIARVYFTYSGTWEYSRETASKKVTGTILFMVMLAVFSEFKLLNMSDGVGTVLCAIVFAIYFVLALIGSLDSKNQENNTWISLIKFVLIYFLSVSSYIIIIVMSLLFATGILLLYKNGFIEKDGDKITFAEILLLCIENMLISIVMLACIDAGNIFSTMLKVAFEETALYSFNYIVIFAVKEKVYSL